jgi:surface-adhesin protein E
MNIPSRSAFFIAAAIFLMAPAIPQHVWAQTPAQMEYERQQREYRLQQERQRQEQQRLQQLMNENARRQQEETNRANAPRGQSPTPSYQSASPQTAARQPAARTDATAATAAAKWVKIESSPTGRDVYADSVTILRSGNLAKMWDMRDFKTAQVVQGTRFLSFKAQHEYDCKAARMRNLSVTAFPGHMGEGQALRSENTRLTWESVTPGSTEEALLKFACGKK